MFVSPDLPKLTHGSHNSQCDIICRRGIWKILRFRWRHKGRAPMMELISSYEGMRAQHSLRSYEWQWPTSQEKPQNDLCQDLNLGLPSLQNLRNKFAISKSPSLHYSVTLADIWSCPKLLWAHMVYANWFCVGPSIKDLLAWAKTLMGILDRTECPEIFCYSSSNRPRQ